jgi:pyruvyltransferase
MQCTYTRPAFAQIIGVGSILERVPDQYEGIVLGSGFAWEQSRLRLPRAKLLAVRGPLTRERVTHANPLVLGDPGLLAGRLLPIRPPVRYRLGFVPHYVDQGNPQLANLSRKHVDRFRVIDVRCSPAEVVAEIASCEAIISSSLHGLIVADALGIPSAWHYVERVLGNGFKFRDHFGVIDRELPPLNLGDESLESLLKLTSPAPARAARIAAELDDLFRDLPAHLRALDISYWGQLRMFLGAKIQRLSGRRRAA